MKWIMWILASALVAACGGTRRPAEVAQYDFGHPAGKVGAAVASTFPLAAIDMQAASWLSGPAMHFRLAYAEPLRRQVYAESRWAAPPAELLGAFLKRRMILGQADFSGSGCRLQMVLDELEQRFDDPKNSRILLEARVLLTPLHGTTILSRRTFQIQKPAAAPAAREGVAAAREAAQSLAEELGGWLAEIARDKPAVVERCRT